MSWEVEFTDEFEAWWDALTGEEQESIVASVGLLETVGPNLKHPHSSGINGSKHGHMRELRTQHEGRPYRTLYAFDPRRAAILPDPQGQVSHFPQLTRRSRKRLRE